MKSKSKVIKICTVIVLAIIVLVVVILLTSSKERYRVIKVKDFNGHVTVEREEENKGKDKLEIFEGMQLVSYDVVTVETGAFLELLADEDKHIGAEGDTGFALYAEGNKKAGMLRIELLYGKALFTIDNKLNDESFFEVNTPNATMSVRGTKFSVSYDPTRNETVIEVFDGIVWVGYASGSTELHAGQVLIINDTGEQILGSDDDSDSNETEDVETSNTTERCLLQVNRIYNDATAIETSTLDIYLFVSDEKFMEGDEKRSGGYSSTPNTRITSGNVKLDSETERLENEYFQAHKTDIDQYFIENFQSATEIYANGGTPEALDVTEWFPEIINIESEGGSYSYHITRVEMVITANGICAITAPDGTANEMPENSFVDGANYSRVQSVNFNIYGW